MVNLTNLITGIVQFPSQGNGWFPFIGKFVYILLDTFQGNAVLTYGVAIILFTIVLKLVLLPMDFLNRYYTKRNANFIQKMKPEEDALRERFAADPMRMMRERQELYRRHGYKMGGFFLFTIINLFVTLAVFMSIVGALNAVATHNTQLTVRELQTVYNQSKLAPEDPNYIENYDFTTEINQAYKDRSVGFLWIDNIWRQDVPWVPASLDSAQYVAYRDGEITDGHIETFRTEKRAQIEADYADNEAERTRLLAELDGLSADQIRNEIKLAEYETINGALDSQYKRKWNGLLIFVILSGATSWVSAFINNKLMKAKRKEEKAKEPKIVYSMRDTKNQKEQQMPQVDPEMMGKIMLLVLPLIMVFFTMNNTAALAIYIITNSLLSTLVSFGMGFAVDKLLAHQDKKSAERGDTPATIDPEVINPHAKYFKTRRKK